MKLVYSISNGKYARLSCVVNFGCIIFPAVYTLIDFASGGVILTLGWKYGAL